MKVKDTFFCRTFSLNCNGRLEVFSEPAVMGIVNLTPDSFFAGSRSSLESDILHKCEKHISEGARILDIGGCSTRPGSETVEEKEEFKRVFPIFRFIRKSFPEILLSIDTFRSTIALQAATEGADIINDVSGGLADPAILNVAAEHRLPYVLTHIKGSFLNMQSDPGYENVVKEVATYFGERLDIIHKAGVQDVILDPGFGFGKRLSDNYSLLKNLSFFGELGYPVLAGISRKGMIQKALRVTADEALDGTTVANTVALMNGAAILRVHDVKPAVQAVRILKLMN